MLCTFFNTSILRFLEQIIQFLQRFPCGSYAIWDPLNTVIYNLYLQHFQHGCVNNFECFLGFSDFEFYSCFNIMQFLISIYSQLPSNLSEILLLLNRCKKSIISESNDSLLTSQNIEQLWYVLERYCWESENYKHAPSKTQVYLCSLPNFM